MAETQLWVGLDVGADEMMVCGIDGRGKIAFEQLIPTKAADLHVILKPLKRRVKLIALETGAASIPLTRALRKLKYPVAVFEARQVSKFLAIRQNKTDRNDAKGLADIARLGRDSVSEVRVKSVECQRLRSMLATRQKLVQLRVATEGTMRSLFRLNGGRLKSSHSPAALKKNVAEELKRLRKVERVDLTSDVEPLLALSTAMRAYLIDLDKKLDKIAADNVVCSMFLEIPGVGTICALSFYSAIEDPTRFQRNADVGAYLGMVPIVRQSGQSTTRHRISKMGDAMTRSYLVTAAMQHIRYTDTSLTKWGRNLAERSGNRRAHVAVARKLAVMMLAMWKSGQSYDPLRGQTEEEGLEAEATLPIAA
jgi:transposase